MRFVWMALAVPVGAALGWAQLMILLRVMRKMNIWLFIAKLPLWALPMLAAAYLSIWALLGLTAGASAVYIGYALYHGIRLRKEGRD